MITKNDCLLLLVDLKKDGVDTTEAVRELLKGNLLPSLQLVNNHRMMDISNFYEKLRKSYNDHHSKLYINIMKELDEDNIEEILTTLNSFALQAMLFKAENKEMFMKHVRLDEVYKVLLKYTIDYDMTKAIDLLRLIKADIKALESTYRS